MENIIEETVVKNDKSLLKSSGKVDSQTIYNWLFDFRQTNYKNRPLTDHFWTVCYLGIEVGVNVRLLLGEEIWGHMKNVKPLPFEILHHPIFEDLKNKKIVIDFHLK
jgi:hypothetical protein